MEIQKQDVGYLYVATGDQYIKEAEKSARRLKSVSPEAKICLVTDKKVHGNYFDFVKIKPINFAGQATWKSNLIYKIEGIAESPFKKTLFLDTDTFVIYPLDSVFNLLEYFDILHCLDHHDHSLIEGTREDLKFYTPYNTGVLFYKDNKYTKKLFADWLHFYQRFLDVYWSDQPAFMHALLNNRVKTYTLPNNYNFRFLNNVSFIENEPVKIIHGRASSKDIEIIEKRVNRTIKNRVWVASRRKTYGWDLPVIQRAFRSVYSVLPGPLKGLLRKIFAY